MRYTTNALAFTLLLASSPFALAQPATATQSKGNPDQTEVQIFYLHGDPHTSLNEISGEVHMVVPNSHAVVMADFSHNAVIVRGTQEDIAVAKKVVDSLDRPLKSWRLTYTVSEMDGDKRIGTQHYSMIMRSGQQGMLKQGDRVPIATGSYAKSGEPASQTQFNYQDIGMSFSATLDELHEGGARLRSDVEKTSLADEKSGFGQQDPVFRSSAVKGEATLLPGKPLVLGTMDMPGSTHHLEIEVLMEPLP